MVRVSWIVPFSPTRPPQAPAGAAVTASRPAVDGGGQGESGEAAGGHGAPPVVRPLRRPPACSWFPRAATIRRGLRDDDAARGARPGRVRRRRARTTRGAGSTAGRSWPRACGPARRRSRSASASTRCTPTSSAAATADEPIRFEVDRLRNGRSFVTRRVVARQAVGAILTMSLSFQVDEAGHDVQIAGLPDVPGPDELRPATRGARCSSGASPRPATRREGRGHRVAAACASAIGDDPILQACALAYLSDDLPDRRGRGACTPSARRPTTATRSSCGFMSASLDHAIWFHRPLAGRRVARARLRQPRLPLQPRPRHRPRPHPRRRPRRHDRPGGPPRGVTSGAECGT